MAQQNAFAEMRRAALARLDGRQPEEIAARTGLSYDQSRQCFTLCTLGQDVQIDYPGYEITPLLDEWHQLLVLHYMDLADGTPLSGGLIPFGAQPGGMVRGGGFDRQSEQELSLRLGKVPRETVEQACRHLGGVLVASNADVCAVFSLFPRYPITLKLWFADEEIPGNGRLFLDACAGHYLSVEDAVTAGSLLLEMLFRSAAVKEEMHRK